MRPDISVDRGSFETGSPLSAPVSGLGSDPGSDEIVHKNKVVDSVVARGAAATTAIVRATSTARAMS